MPRGEFVPVIWVSTAGKNDKRHIPVTMTTFPFTLGPLEGGAIFLRIGMSSNLPWSGIGATSCSLREASLRFAEADILIGSTELYLAAEEDSVWVERKEIENRSDCQLCGELRFLELPQESGVPRLVSRDYQPLSKVTVLAGTLFILHEPDCTLVRLNLEDTVMY